MPPIVEFKQVEKRYGEGPVILDRISFTAERGDFIALIGPSGCGKSTILKLISGLSPLSGGSVAVDGMEPDNALEELAFVFQEPTLLPWLTVQKNVEVPLRLRSTRADRRSDLATKSLALVGLSERAGYYPRQLSGGQKMRVSIARAHSLSPKILLLDTALRRVHETQQHSLFAEQ